MKPFTFSILLLALGITARAQTTAPLPWEVSGGLTYVTGDYGLNADTDVWVQTTSITYQQDAWKFTGTVPIVSLSGPASVVGEVGRPGSSSETGLGDVTLAATYSFINPETKTANFDFTTRLKLPTADEAKGLGTGKADVNFELNYRHPVGRVTPFATLGYRIVGSSAAYPLKNGVYTTAGVAAPVSTDGTVAGLALTWREKIVSYSDDSFEAMAFISHPLSERLKLQAFVLRGFTDASPNLGLGAQVGYRF